MPPKYVTPAEAARISGLSRTALHNHLWLGKIKGAKRFGPYWMVPRSEAERLAGEPKDIGGRPVTAGARSRSTRTGRAAAR